MKITKCDICGKECAEVQFNDSEWLMREEVEAALGQRVSTTEVGIEHVCSGCEDVFGMALRVARSCYVESMKDSLKKMRRAAGEYGNAVIGQKVFTRVQRSVSKLHPHWVERSTI